DSTMHRMTPVQWAEVIQTNLGSCFNLCRCVIDSMRARNFGRIVNIGSINGQAGQYGQVNYAAAKSGIHGFTKALAQEGAAKGITVNAIAPGLSAEPSYDGLGATPPSVADEFARLAVFLSTPSARHITGQTMHVSRGSMATLG
ncbi:MAG: SDR family NAD(P)-dependent oxidoreductase, partial [Pseudonocardia sp.]